MLLLFSQEEAMLADKTVYSDSHHAAKQQLLSLIQMRVIHKYPHSVNGEHWYKIGYSYHSLSL